VLKLEEVPKPTPREGEVLVKVSATGVHPMDWKLRTGMLKEFMPLELPHVPGYEFAGTIEAVGEGVTGFTPGDDVFGQGSGTYAEYAVAPATSIAKKPAKLSFEDAVPLGLSGVSAWSAVDLAAIQPGQRVLVLGGAGGVGAVAVQLVHRKRAHVIATTSTANLEYVKGLGADKVVDYTKEIKVSPVDVVIDTVGGDALDKSWALLKKGGTLVAIAGMVDPKVAEQHGVKLEKLAQLATTTPILEELAKLAADGQLKSPVAEKFKLDDAARAHEASQTGHGRGRRVLTIA
jgi:NADPH:quinone reductase-like Zn-dependent oxidoreductase